MPKYTLKPITSTVIETYKENSNGDTKADAFINGIPAELIITAQDENQLLDIRSIITHYPSWEIVKTEE
jgi:hypothetical protein